uniref:Uncharacterized protein n=1 Tax=Anopheles funestus TaxID=62324 RepID=A0A4Y0BFP5_ANOFN
MFGTLIGNNGTRQPPVSQGTVVPCHKGELHKSRVMKRRQAFTATASYDRRRPRPRTAIKQSKTCRKGVLRVECVLNRT